MEEEIMIIPEAERLRTPQQQLIHDYMTAIWFSDIRNVEKHIRNGVKPSHYDLDFAEIVIDIAEREKPGTVQDAMSVRNIIRNTLKGEK